MAGQRDLSFGVLDAQSACFAGGLAARGVRRGDRVLLHLPNGAEWLIAYHALARLGAVVVPVNTLLTSSEVAYMAADADVAAMIVPAARREAIHQARGWERRLLTILTDASTEDGFEALLSGHPLDPIEVAPDDLFTICYTSGTTGRPKGAIQTHRAVFASAAMTAMVHGRVRGETVLTALPFTHVYGNVVMNAALLVGMRLVVLPRFDPGEALAAIGKEGPALFEGVPTMYYQMLTHPGIDATDFSSLRCCTVGGQTMPLARIDEVVARFGCPLCELWGMTEVAGPAMSHSPHWPPRHGSIGLPFPNVETRLASLDDKDHAAADGEPGELLVRGPQVTPGYWRDPVATDQSIASDGWLATGDIAVRDADGYFRIVDRRKDVIITGGYNIYPAELEQVLSLHPSVAMVAVAPMVDLEKGELAKAFVVLRPGTQCTAQQLDRHCRDHLAPYKVPRLYVFVDDLPKSSTGKILRRELREAIPPAPMP